jgi:predicted  nucleic acid-binding Zn-ribbon protein
MRKTISLSLAASAMLIASARADFTPPKDGKLTEKQVTNFIEITKDQMATLKSAGNAAQGVGGVAGAAIVQHASEKMDASITSHGMTKDEYNWVGEQVTKLWPVALYQKQWEETGKPDLEKQIKAKQADEDDAKAKLTTYQNAQKAGTRLMTKDQRQAAVDAATTDRNTANDDVKSATEALKPINDEIAQHDKDATDAEALAKNPPADVSADDRSNYIDARKNEAQAAHDAAKDARDRLKDAQKAVDDAKARVTAAGNRVDHPEVPVTDDDKASVKQENDQAIAEATKQIADDDDAIKTLKETLAAGPMDLTANSKDKPDPDNLALVKKHVSEYMDAIGANDKK